MREGVSEEGNMFIVAYNRSQPSDSISQKFQIQQTNLYSFSAWVQISEGSETVDAMFQTTHGELIRGGSAIAKHGCWSLLKGGMVAHLSGPVEIFFVCNNTRVEVWIDNVSFQPFTAQQWRSHQDKSIEEVRKSKVRFQVAYANGTALSGAAVSIKQTRPGFPFGCGMNHNILTSNAYQKWFASRFKLTTFTNEMKWYSTEIEQGHENYTIADAMLSFAKKNGIAVRGHNILWDNPKMQPQWVKNLSPRELRIAATKRTDSVVRRYSGKLIAWDVMNENMHFSFYEDKLGRNASSEYYLRAYQLDPRTKMFLNEYNTIEYSKEILASPVNYVKKIKEILSYPGIKGILLGIGVQGHFSSGPPNLVYMRSALDILGSTGLPIWLTEVDVQKGPNQAQYFESILREGYSHPAVQGIIIFAGPEVAGFSATTLTDKDFKNTPSGNVVDKLIAEWKTRTLKVIADGKGFAEASLFKGDYNLIVEHPVTNLLTRLRLKVKEDKFQETIVLRVTD
ncbi:HYDROLYZING O-GLYCOSYL COMPOUNDS putative-RELATED [Salix koriyanagi]|uniref:HYDROLYZING O-GLYCOSYL COMPOUNDS putative-RELATED n=2 Tax=Salix TaxID=40685 RepID=A0A9Q0TRK0_9ROSI|nr:HYDROLYZING O-GLYCOSYL COMPOUNDS putative-RELATED [Salix koriyanagi]